jgi:glucan phosphoethanolaminetransferase (alkaline phosphatase superfamily)
MLEEDELPHISGVHGVFKRMDDLLQTETETEKKAAKSFFNSAEMEQLHKQQIRCVEYVDGLLGELFSKCPSNTHIIVTADHGELFGEDGYFGHGPVMHEKCFEVPFLEGLCPKI